MKKRVMALFLTWAVALSLVTLPAAAAGSSPVVSNNRNDQDYSVWSTPVRSYLMENEAGGLTRVEYTGGQVVVEDYSSDFVFQSGRTIPMELTIWGGFFAGADYNFFVFGQKNPTESDSTEVIRVVKYSKDWQRLGQASLYGANTTVPFDAGSLRMDEYGGYLYLRTSHEMYTSDDGLNHQANLTMAVRQSDMTVTDSYYEVMNTSYGYVSHSFNQFILVDQQGRIVTLDHGDAYPRAMTFMRYYADAGSGKFSGSGYGAWCSVGLQRTFAGAVGANTTGASVGGLAETSSCYMMAYNYDGEAGTGPRNVYLQAMDIATGKGKDYQITQSGGSTTPVLAPTGLDGGYLLWNGKEGYTVSDTLYYLAYGADGVPGKTQTAQAPLSDCQPIPYRGGVVWYVTDNSAPVFYTLDSSGVSVHGDGTAEQPEEPEPNPEPDPDPDPQPNPDPDPAPSGEDEAKLPAGGGNHTLSSQTAILADGTLVAWGSAKADIWDEKLETVGGGYAAVSQLGTDFFALKEDGTLCGWGRTKLSTLTTKDPVQLLTGVKQIGGFMALKNDGTVWCVQGLDPVYVTSNAKQVSYDGVTGIILKNDGTVYAYEGGSEPTLERGPLEDVRYISGYMAIRNNGELWYWGRSNDFGVSGTGSQVLNGPVKVMDNVANVWGENVGRAVVPSVFALTEDGSLYSWGVNTYNQLGYQGGNQEYELSPSVFGENAGTMPYQDIPKRVNISNVADVCSTNATTLILKTDGTIWAVGNNASSDALLPLEIERVDTLTQVLEGVLLPGDPPKQTGKPAFSDVSAAHWANEAIGYAVDNGYFSGTGAGTFSPDGTMTRAMLWTVLSRMDGYTGTAKPGDPWYESGREWAVANGISDGTNPDGSVTREQFATMLYNFAAHTNTSTSKDNAVLNQFGDRSAIASYAVDAMAWAVSNGVMSGSSSTTISPTGLATRAQAAVMLMQFDKLSEG